MPEDLWPSFKQSERQLSRLERRPSFKEKLKDRNYSLAMQRYREQEAAQEAEIARLRRRIPGENVDPEQKYFTTTTTTVTTTTRDPELDAIDNQVKQMQQREASGDPDWYLPPKDKADDRAWLQHLEDERLVEIERAVQEATLSQKNRPKFWSGMTPAERQQYNEDNYDAFVQDAEPDLEQYWRNLDESDRIREKHAYEREQERRLADRGGYVRPSSRRYIDSERERQKDVESSGALRGSRTPPSRKYIDSGRERQRLREKYG